MATDTLFRQKAPGIMRKLMADFGLDVTSAAAIVGNLGHESAGFRFLQEIKPLIPGSAGGYGWAQWTGPRRRAYEKFCKDKSLDPASDEANYGYLVYELRNTEVTAIPAVKRAVGLHNKVVAFELAFERASDQHKGYPSREKWAGIALSAFGPAQPDIEPVNVPVPKPSSGGRVAGGAGGAIVVVGSGAVIAKKTAEKDAGFGEIAAVVVITFVIAIAVYFIIRHWRKS